MDKCIFCPGCDEPIKTDGNMGMFCTDDMQAVYLYPMCHGCTGFRLALPERFQYQIDTAIGSRLVACPKRYGCTSFTTNTDPIEWLLTNQNWLQMLASAKPTATGK